MPHIQVADRGIAPFAAKSETKPATLLPPVPPTAAAAPPVESKAEPEKFEKKDNPSPAAKAPVRALIKSLKAHVHQQNYYRTVGYYGSVVLLNAVQSKA
jgi:hypothetical protein